MDEAVLGIIPSKIAMAATVVKIATPKPLPIIRAVFTSPEAIPLYSFGLSPIMNFLLGGLKAATEAPIIKREIDINIRFDEELKEAMSMHHIMPTTDPINATLFGLILSEMVPAIGPATMMARGMIARAIPD